MSEERVDWRAVALQLARDVLSLAEDAGMPDSYKQTDQRMKRAYAALANDGGT